ncbi:MAG: hypothetical protein AAF511_00160 [Pseudomonadota bacterium]
MAMLVVAGLLVFMSFFHTFIGERYILGPLKRTDNLPEIMNSQRLFFVTIQATWHLVSVLWLGVAAQLMSLYFYPDMAGRSFLIIFAVLFSGLAVTPFLINATQYKTWIAFALIGGLFTWSALTWG